MIKKFAGCLREYKKPTILTLIFIVGEAFIETFIPFITARLVNLIKYGAPMEQVVRDTDRDHFMGAEEARAWGLIDQVLVPKKA